MVLTEIALLKWQTNENIVLEDCWFAVQLSRRIWGKLRSFLNYDHTLQIELYVTGVTVIFKNLQALSKHQIKALDKRTR